MNAFLYCGIYLCSAENRNVRSLLIEILDVLKMALQWYKRDYVKFYACICEAILGEFRAVDIHEKLG